MGQIFSDDAAKQKKSDKCRQVWRWKKKMAHYWSETNVTFVDNIFQRRKRVSLRNRLRQAVHKWIYGMNISDDTAIICRQCILKEKKNFIAKQSEKRCDQMNIWDKYFLMIQQKSATSVDKCDNEKIGPSLVWNNCNICRQCILKEKKISLQKDWDKRWPKHYMGQLFSDETAKTARQV